MTAENTYLLNHLYSAYYYGAGDYEKSFPYIKKNQEYIQNNAHLFKEEPNIYLSILSNLIYIGMQLKKFDEVEHHLNQLDALPKELLETATENQEMRIFTLEMSSRLALFTVKEEYDKGIALIPTIEEGILKYGCKLSAVRRSFFFFNIAVLHFWKGEYNIALKWINQLLNDIDIDDTQDIHCMAQIFYLIIHLELGNKSLLPYSLRSTKRYLETRNRVYKFEKVLLDFVNEQLKKRPSQTEKEQYTGLVSELETLSKDSFEKHVFEYFDFLKWAKGKVDLGN
jgi:tetratricopeptide (TPR) repeat protein